MSCSNLSAVLNTRTTALGILMTCATAWLQAMIESDRTPRKRIVVVDEAWRILSNLGIGQREAGRDQKSKKTV